MTWGLVLGALLAAAAVVVVAWPFLREPGLDPERDRLANPDAAERRRLELAEERDRALARAEGARVRPPHGQGLRRGLPRARRPPAPARGRDAARARPPRRRATCDSSRTGTEQPWLTAPSAGPKLPRNARFCAECGRRVDDTDATAVEPVPPDETGPVPVHIVEAEPRLFGITPATALFGAGLAALALGILLVAIGYVLAGALLIGAAVLLFAAFATAAQRRPDTAVARVSADAARLAAGPRGLCGRDARRPRQRPRRALPRSAACCSTSTRSARRRCRMLGEAVYRGDEEAAAAGRDRVAALDREVEARHEELMRVTSSVEERVQKAQLAVQATEIRQDVELPGPVPVPEPSPEPSPPVEPPLIPEPSPEPSPPVEPPLVPEPGPTPAPEPSPEPPAPASKEH